MPDPFFPDTIVAIATPPGRGGIGIVRLSGPQATAIAMLLVRLRRPLEPRRAQFVTVPDPSISSVAAALSGDDSASVPVLDEAVITAFPGPNSYTGEDVIEIAAHGSPVVLETLLSAALTHGARLAEPGEFTQRAFLAGRLDLTEAEAVHDLIAAHTLEQARAAAQQLGGALSRRVAAPKERLLQLIALLEAGMDFASGELDDVDVVSPHQITTTLTEVQSSLADLAASFRSGSLLRNGASLALIGRPNAGKSSLFNRLLERPRAIVTAIPGTTRDTVEETWSLGGIPIRLVDTAGLRLAAESPVDEAERLGIERSREALADADLVLLVHDATLAPTLQEHELAQQLAGRPCLLLRNKVDLLPVAPPQTSSTPVTAPPWLAVSALTGEGLPELRAAISATLQAGSAPFETGALNNRRQHQSVLAALEALKAAHLANNNGLPHEILLLDLHNALRALDELTGATTADDILHRIFSTFCIGK